MTTPNPRIQALILNSRIKEKIQTELKKKKKQNSESNKHLKQSTAVTVTEASRPRMPLVTRLNSSQDSLNNKENSQEAESIEITVIKSNSEDSRNNLNRNSLHVDHNVLRIKALEKLNDELIEQNKSLKQQLLISQSNCSLILSELAKTKKKLNILLRA